jgi:hypothetical protein
MLADLWGYSSYHAIARGVVTPKNDKKVILFVTEEKQNSLEQYADRLEGNTLHWEGPNDHFGEGRMLDAASSGDEIHLFYRTRHHTDFLYMGRVTISGFTAHTARPSQFTLRIVDQ